MMRIFLILNIWIMAFVLLGVYGPRSGMDLSGQHVYNVRSYGAVADATLASGCGWLDDADLNDPSCDTPGTGTDDSAAFDAAIDAAGAVGGGKVHVPCGDYRIGAATGGSTYTAATFIDQDNIILQGNGDCSRLLFNHDAGGMLIAICASSTCSSGTTVRNIKIRDLMIMDDDPEAHGHGQYHIVVAGTVNGTPASGDSADWDATGSTGTVLRWDAANSTMRIHRLGGSGPEADDTIQLVGGAGWNISDLTVTDPTAEESHGVYGRYCDNVEVSNVHVRGFGDEAFEFMHCDNVRVHDSVFENNPSIPASGSVLNFGNGTDNAMVYNNFANGGVKYYTGSHHEIFKVSTNATASADHVNTVRFSNNIMVDTSTREADCVGAGDPSSCCTGAATGADCHLGYVGIGLLLVNNTNDYNITGVAFSDNSNLIDDEDTGGGAVAASTTEDREIYNLTMVGNDFAGEVDLSGDGFDDAILFVGNRGDDSSDEGLNLDGAQLATVVGNTFDTSEDECIKANDTLFSAFVGNTFHACGGGADEGLQETGTSDYNLAAANLSSDNGDDVEIGTVPIEGSNGDGIGAHAVVSGNLVRDAIVVADVPDCQGLAHGTTVTITDDTAIAACTDADTNGILDGGGAATSQCICDPSGDSGDGTWSNLP